MADRLDDRHSGSKVRKSLQCLWLGECNVGKVDLVLSVHRSGWHKGAFHGGETDRDRRVREAFDQVMRREDYTCQGCGWRSERFQQVHPKDHDHRHMSVSNLVCLCPLCHQVFHINMASSAGSGDLIWLPEISQASLNLISIAMFVALRDPRHSAYQLAKLLDVSLRARVQVFRSHFPKADAGLLAECLLNMSPEAYDNRAQTLKHIRLLPRPELFRAAIDHWATHEFANFPEDKWEEVLPKDLDIPSLMKTDQAA